jgi:hypothetical protein
MLYPEDANEQNLLYQLLGCAWRGKLFCSGCSCNGVVKQSLTKSFLGFHRYAQLFDINAI